VIQDVVYYRVTVALADSTDKEIFNGMTANVVFATAQKENALYVPQRAVLTNAEKYVRVLENNQVKEVPVILGLKGDGGMVEITSGLSEGQDVVVGTTQ